jgi:hypothetical protein
MTELEALKLVLAMAVEYSGDLVHADALVQAAGDVKAGGLVQDEALEATRQLIAKVEHADSDAVVKQDMAEDVLAEIGLVVPTYLTAQDVREHMASAGYDELAKSLTDQQICSALENQFMEHELPTGWSDWRWAVIWDACAALQGGD